MKTFFHRSAALLAVLAAQGAQGAFVHDSGTEFTTSGDFNGDGIADVAVIGRANGLYRIGYGTSGGSFTWGQAQPGGLVNLTGVASGKVNSTLQDSLFFASVEGNRITFVSPTSPVYNPPTDFLVGGVGPKVLAALDIAGGSPANTAHADLVTGSVLNPSVQPSSLRAYRSIGNSTITQMGSVASADPWIRAMALKPNTAAAEMVLLQRATGNSEAFTLYAVSSGTPAATVLSATGLPSGSRLAYGVFDSTQTDIISWVPGSPSAVVRRINPGVNGFSSTINRTLPQGIQQLYVIHNGIGQQVLILHSNGTAVIYQYTSAAGFVAVTTLSLTGAPGVLSGATASADGSFQLLFAQAEGEPSSHLWRFSASGGTWAQQGQETMPKAGAYAGLANVLYLNEPPFRSSSPQVLRRTSIGDWTEQISLGGAPAAATAAWRDDLGSASGLGATTSQPLGSAPNGTQSVLYNQWRPSISLFWLEGLNGAVNEEVVASPAGGSFAQSVSVTLRARGASSAVYYRTNSADPFVAYSAPVVLYGDTTLETYALKSGIPSAIQKISYQFTASPDQQDADNDGVPDFVERSKGLDPTGGQDSDGDGFTDLEEILAGKNPGDSSSKPAQHDDSAARFDIAATVVGHDGLGNAPAAPMNAVELSARDVEDAQLGTGLTGGGNGAVSLQASPVESSLRLLSLASPANFPLTGASPDPDVGREMIGLVAVPDGVVTAVPFTYDFAAASTQAQAWITAAQTAHAGVVPAGLSTTLNITDTLITAMVEWGLTGMARERGLIPPSGQLCFTKWRPTDAINPDMQALSPDALRSLELPEDVATATTAPCVLIRESLASLTAAVEGPSGIGLRALAQEIYRISSRYSNADPGRYGLPVDVIREFVWHGTLPAAYRTQSGYTDPQLAQLSTSLTGVVSAAITARPVVTLAVTPAPAGGSNTSSLVDTVPPAISYRLIDALGQDFEFPETFSLPAGSVMTVVGFTDRPAHGGYAALEVVSVLITSLGVPSPTDTDGNLLPDAWELAFFGAIGQDPYTSGDGSAYSRLQEYFEGTDPGCKTDSPATPPMTIGATNVRLDPGSRGNLMLRFDFPAAYASRVKGRFTSSTDLASWQDLAEGIYSDGSFALTITPLGNRRFYQGRVSLK